MDNGGEEGTMNRMSILFRDIPAITPWNHKNETQNHNAGQSAQFYSYKQFTQFPS